MHCQYIQTNCNEYYYYNYRLDGDTLLNGNIHKKIMKDSVILVAVNGFSSCLLDPWASFTGYMGALKEDTINNRTFIVLPGQSNDTLFYDYNLNIGDTVRGYLIASCKPVVNSIDSVLIGAGYRKRWNFITCNEGPGYIIQGIGSDNGLIETINSPGFCYSRLICVKDSNTVLYTANASPMACQRILTGVNGDDKKGLFSILPNPSSGVFTISSSEKLQYCVYDIFGREVLQSTNPDQSITLDLTPYPKGIYFVRGKSGDKIFSRKIILQ
jgi:hypothetical protein